MAVPIAGNFPVNVRNPSKRTDRVGKLPLRVGATLVALGGIEIL